jgi:hypothetical protein
VVMVSRLVEIWVIGKGGIKKGGWQKGWMGGGRVMGTAGFCGPCACLGEFLML